MRGGLCAALIVMALGVWPSPARADEPAQVSDASPPSTGLGYLITGGVLLGLGGANALASYPFCALEQSANELSGGDTSSNFLRTCLEVSLTISGVLVVAGIPLLVVGGQQRHVYKEWKKDHAPTIRIIEHVSFVPSSSGAMVGWHGEF